MFDLRTRHDQLGWEDIEPTLSRLYLEYLTLQHLIWAQRAWARLRSQGLTRAGSPLETLDSFSRAISLFEFHRLVVEKLVGHHEEPEFDELLEGTVSEHDLAVLAVVRYQLPRDEMHGLAESLDSVLCRLYLHHAPRIVESLYRSHRSADSMHDEIVSLSDTFAPTGCRIRNHRVEQAIGYIRYISGRDKEPGQQTARLVGGNLH